PLCGERTPERSGIFSASQCSARGLLSVMSGFGLLPPEVTRRHRRRQPLHSHPPDRHPPDRNQRSTCMSTLGVVRERPGETRVAASPVTVSKIIALGYDVVVETGAGA